MPTNPKETHSKLEGGSLYWPVTTLPEPVPSLAADLSCEVVVLGAGITGAMAGHAIAERGVEIAVIDAGQPANESTAATTALVQYEIDTTLTELTEYVGEDHARGAYRACRDALHDLSSVVATLDDPCELCPRPSLFLATRAADVRALEQEVKLRQTARLDAEWLDAKALLRQFNISRPGAILTATALELNPVKLTRALLRRAAGARARIFGDTRLSIRSLSGDGVELATPAGATVRCRHLVIATGYAAPDQFNFLRPLVTLRSTYAAATVPANPHPWPQRALIWEKADPYFYARCTPDGRIIMGGEDNDLVEASARDGKIQASAAKLSAKLTRLIPGVNAAIDFAWAGTFGQTEDGLPFIGSLPHWPRVHFALGYGGNGITFSQIASRIIAQRVSGRTHPLEKLFSFDRAADVLSA